MSMKTKYCKSYRAKYFNIIFTQKNILNIVRLQNQRECFSKNSPNASGSLPNLEVENRNRIRWVFRNNNIAVLVP